MTPTNEVAALKRTLARILRGAPGGLITVGAAARALRLPARAASIRLGALARAGWLTRLRRGLYFAIPLEAESATQVVPDDPWLVADAVFAPCYIGGWSAASHWELTEQLFQSTFVVSAAAVRHAEQTFGGLTFHVARVSKSRIRGAAQVWRGPRRSPVSGRERTVVDALITPSWLGGIRHVADVLSEYVASSRGEYTRLLKILDEVGTGAAQKRFAFLVESLYPESQAAHEAARQALRHGSSGIVKLDPDVQARGTIHRRWGLSINVPIEPAT